jgi:hypothetical protein
MAIATVQHTMPKVMMAAPERRCEASACAVFLATTPLPDLAASCLCLVSLRGEILAAKSYLALFH